MNARVIALTAAELSEDERAILKDSIERVDESLRLKGEAFHVKTGGGGHYYGTDLRNLVNVARWWLELSERPTEGRPGGLK